MQIPLWKEQKCNPTEWRTCINPLREEQKCKTKTVCLLYNFTLLLLSWTFGRFNIYTCLFTIKKYTYIHMYHAFKSTSIMMTSSFTLRDKLSPRLIRLYLYSDFCRGGLIVHHLATRICAAAFWFESCIGTNKICKTKWCLLKGLC